MAGAPAVLVRGLVLMHRAYVRFEDGMPANENLYAAARGFRLRGAEIVPFTNFSDIPVGELGPDVCVCGYVGDVLRALDAMGKPRPAPLDYPDELQTFLLRLVVQESLGTVRGSPLRCFVKPLEHKLFTGLVWDSSDAARRALCTFDDSVRVWTSDVVSFVSEWRVFVLGGEILGTRHYKGDPLLAPTPVTVERILRAYSGRPAAFALDVGVLNPADYGLLKLTAIVEVNDAFALGSYGLAPALYAQMIEARWRELVS